jgi:hypothetical protein
MPYPSSLLPHVSSNNMGHLELKNLSANLFFGLPTDIFGNLGLVTYRSKGLEIDLLSGVLHAPKRLKITIGK